VDPTQKGRPAGNGPTPDDCRRHAQDTHGDPPPSCLDLGNGEALTIGTAADFRAAAEWLARNYPEHSADAPTRTGEPVIFNMGWHLMEEVLDCYHGPHVKKLWLLAFARSANDQSRQGWPGRALLARGADVSPPRASNLATELAEDGVIKRVGGGGKHRGEARYEMLPLAVDVDGQGSPRPNPDEPVDNSSQGSPRPNPETWPQGSESHPQGSESASQGSAISPSPAETPHNSQEGNSQIKQQSSLSAPGPASDGLDDERENDDFGDDDDKPDPDAVLLAAAVPAADWRDVEGAITTLQMRKYHGKIRTSVRAYLRACITNGDAQALIDEAASERRLNEVYIAQHGDPFDLMPRTTVQAYVVADEDAGYGASAQAAPPAHPAPTPYQIAVGASGLYSPAPNGTGSRPPWCGKCSESTRQREDDAGRPYRCPECHPLGATGSLR
jgi:hypothetical protein